MKRMAVLAVTCLMLSVGVMGALSQQVRSSVVGKDLTVEDIEKTTGYGGHRVKALIHNLGTQDIATDFDTAFFLDDTSHCIGVHHHSGLDGGSSVWAYSDTFQASGRHKVIVITDYNHDISEYNENNNQASKWFYWVLA